MHQYNIPNVSSLDLDFLRLQRNLSFVILSTKSVIILLNTSISNIGSYWHFLHLFILYVAYGRTKNMIKLLLLIL